MESDWILGLAGGLMIGAAAALFLLGNGRIMGVSGILGGIVEGSERGQRRERLFFLAGLIGLPFLLSLLFRGAVSTGITSNIVLILCAGFAVGLGTRVGNGCTSGHGVCGMARLSLRSIAATCTFIAAGVVTVVLLRAFGGM